jgi:2'-5' RNA ligase
MLVVELSFETAGDRIVRNIWQALADANVSTSMIDKPFHPHISLGMIPYEKQSGFQNTLKSFATQLSPISVNMPHYGIFTSPGHVIFLGVTVTDALYNLHRTFYQAFANDVDVTTLYTPDFWIPHCTLAYDLTAEKAPLALGVCQQFPLPITSYINEIGVVESDTGEVVVRHLLH